MKSLMFIAICALCAIIFAGCNLQGDDSGRYELAGYDLQNDALQNDDLQNDEPDRCENGISTDFVSNHPWNEGYKIEAMPVFRNPIHRWPAGMARHEGLSANRLSDYEMTTKAENIVAALGMEVETIGASVRIVATSANLEVTVESCGVVWVDFDAGFFLPDGIVFLWGRPEEEAIEYLTKIFAPALGLSFNIYADIGECIVERILDYHFNRLRFVPGLDDRPAFVERPPLPGDVLSDKIGYFPIVTLDEAVLRMLDGQGSFGVEHGQTRPIPDDVVDVRLVYFGHGLGRSVLEEFAPWYRFIVKTPCADHFQAFFVPAVQTPYLNANPAWAYFPHQ